MFDNDNLDTNNNTPFFRTFLHLCVRDNISPTAAAIRAGMSNAAANKWANGAIPSRKTKFALASSFNVTVPQLMGEEPLPNSQSGESQGLSTDSVFIYKHANSQQNEKPTPKGELDSKAAISAMLDGMTEAELMLVLERVQKIINSR